MSDDLFSRPITRRGALALGAGALLLATGGVGIDEPEPAYADAADGLGSVWLERGANLYYFDNRIDWDDGGINLGTTWRHVTLNGHRLSAFCVNPALHGPSNASLRAYDIEAYVSATAVEETRILMWFAPGQPGFDRSMWPIDAPHRNDYHWQNPDEGIYGHPQTMSDDDYRCCVAHVALAWALGGRSNARGAYTGLGSDTLSWFQSRVLSTASTATFGRALARANEVPSRGAYDIFLLNPDHSYQHPDYPGSPTQAILCSVWRDTGYAKVKKGPSHGNWV